MFSGLNHKDMGFKELGLWRWSADSGGSRGRDRLCWHQVCRLNSCHNGRSRYYLCKIHPYYGRCRECLIHNYRYSKGPRRLRSTSFELRAPKRREQHFHSAKRSDDSIRHPRKADRPSIHHRWPDAIEGGQRVYLRQSFRLQAYLPEFQRIYTTEVTKIDRLIL